MDTLLPALLTLPFAAAVVIVVVSFLRRRRHGRTHEITEPVHRAQADTAAVQSAAVYPPAKGRIIRGGRERRAGAAARGRDDQAPSSSSRRDLEALTAQRVRPEDDCAGTMHDATGRGSSRAARRLERESTPA